MPLAALAAPAHRRRARDQEGFTLVELLVVILIIGILAAIALPSFLQQRDKSQDAWAKSVTRNAVTQMESCVADKPGSSASAVTACASSPQVTGDGETSVEVAPGGGVYSITAVSPSGGDFTIVKVDGSPGHYERRCGELKLTRGCRDDGSW